MRCMRAGMYLGQTSRCAHLESHMEEVLVAPSVAVLLTYLFLRLISSLNLTEGCSYCSHLILATRTVCFVWLILRSNRCVLFFWENRFTKISISFNCFWPRLKENCTFIFGQLCLINLKIKIKFWVFLEK